MPGELGEDGASFVTTQLLKIFRKELQNVKKEKREKKRRYEKKATSKGGEAGKPKEETPPPPPKDARLNFRDAILLLVHVYSLCGPETGAQISSSDGEDKLKAIFSKYVEELLQTFALDENAHDRLDEAEAPMTKEALAAEHEPLALRLALKEAVRERKGVEAMVENLFQRLKAVSQARSNLKTFKRLYDPGEKRRNDDPGEKRRNERNWSDGPLRYIEADRVAEKPDGY